MNQPKIVFEQTRRHHKNTLTTPEAEQNPEQVWEEFQALVDKEDETIYCIRILPIAGMITEYPKIEWNPTKTGELRAPNQMIGAAFEGIASFRVEVKDFAYTVSIQNAEAEDEVYGEYFVSGLDDLASIDTGDIDIVIDEGSEEASVYDRLGARLDNREAILKGRPSQPVEIGDLANIRIGGENLPDTAQIRFPPNAQKLEQDAQISQPPLPSTDSDWGNQIPTSELPHPVPEPITEQSWSEDGNTPKRPLDADGISAHVAQIPEIKRRLTLAPAPRDSEEPDYEVEIEDLNPSDPEAQALLASPIGSSAQADVDTQNIRDERVTKRVRRDEVDILPPDEEPTEGVLPSADKEEDLVGPVLSTMSTWSSDIQEAVDSTPPANAELIYPPDLEPTQPDMKNPDAEDTEETEDKDGENIPALSESVVYVKPKQEDSKEPPPASKVIKPDPLPVPKLPPPPSEGISPRMVGIGVSLCLLIGIGLVYASLYEPSSTTQKEVVKDEDIAMAEVKPYMPDAEMQKQIDALSAQVKELQAREVPEQTVDLKKAEELQAEIDKLKSDYLALDNWAREQLGDDTASISQLESKIEAFQNALEAKSGEDGLTEAQIAEIKEMNAVEFTEFAADARVQLEAGFKEANRKLEEKLSKLESEVLRFQKLSSELEAAARANPKPEPEADNEEDDALIAESDDDDDEDSSEDEADIPTLEYAEGPDDQCNPVKRGNAIIIKDGYYKYLCPDDNHYRVTEYDKSLLERPDTDWESLMLESW